jgi:dUTPase
MVARRVASAQHMGTAYSSQSADDDDPRESRGSTRERFIPALLEENAVLPIRASPDAAGFQLRSNAEVELGVGVTEIPTGVGFTLPPGLAGYVIPNAALAAEHGVFIQTWHVDATTNQSITLYATKIAGDPIILEQGSVVATIVFSPAVVGVNCASISTAEEDLSVAVDGEAMNEKAPLKGRDANGNGKGHAEEGEEEGEDAV